MKNAILLQTTNSKHAGIILDDEELDEGEGVEEEIKIEEITNSPVERMTLTELNQQLKEAIENEDYEAASNIRDEINRRKGN